MPKMGDSQGRKRLLLWDYWSYEYTLEQPRQQ